MREEITPSLGLNDLLDRSLSSYEYYTSLPPDIQEALAEYDDIQTFEELQEAAIRLKEKRSVSNV